MSVLWWVGQDHIFQAIEVGDETSAELGYVRYDEHSKTWVLWLKDHFDDYGQGSRYMRGDEWGSYEEAKANAMSSASARLFNLRYLMSLDTARCFMAMQFGDPQLDQVVKDYIRPSIKESFGITVNTSLDVSAAGLIDDIIREGIRTSKFMLVDLTHANNGAYWEAGFAEGCGVPVIYLCEQRIFQSQGTHFDTNHLTTVLWSIDRLDEFVATLIQTVSNTIKRS